MSYTIIDNNTTFAIDQGDRVENYSKDCTIYQSGEGVTINQSGRITNLDYSSFNIDTVTDNASLYSFLADLCLDNGIAPIMHAAKNIIYTENGHYVSFNKRGKTERKYGRYDSLGTSEEMVWLLGGVETLATGNDIDTISSSDAGDTLEVIIEGHTISNGDLTFVSQTATLDGQNQVTLSTPLYRASRFFNNNGVDLQGSAFVYQSGGTVTNGVPQDATLIHIETDGTNNQSLKCATSVASNTYWCIDSIMCGVTRQNDRSVDFKLQMRESGMVFRTRLPLPASSSSGGVPFTLGECLIFPPNCDMRMIAQSSGVSTGVTAVVSGPLGEIIGQSN